jgi:DNA-binding transcriptional ArsR family regulator
MPRPARERGADLKRGLYAIRLLRETPRIRGELARRLGCSLDTVDRTLDVLRRAGLQLTRTEDGREVYYSLPADTFARVMP